MVEVIKSTKRVGDYRVIHYTSVDRATLRDTMYRDMQQLLRHRFDVYDNGSWPVWHNDQRTVKHTHGVLAIIG